MGLLPLILARMLPGQHRLPQPQGKPFLRDILL